MQLSTVRALITWHAMFMVMAAAVLWTSYSTLDPHVLSTATANSAQGNAMHLDATLTAVRTWFGQHWAHVSALARGTRDAFMTQR